jgi:two-component system NtrC family sensor kinase
VRRWLQQLDPEGQGGSQKGKGMMEARMVSTLETRQPLQTRFCEQLMPREWAGKPGGGLMSGKTIPGVLMLRCSAVSHHAVRTATRQAGLAVSIEFVENRREFVDELRRGTTRTIIAGLEGLPDLEVREMLDRARHAQSPIPVILIGGRIRENEAINILREGAAEYLHTSEIEHLPSAIARSLRVWESTAAEARAEQELDTAATLLRENQKLITMGRLAASIAHEINNPLESVTNLLYLLGEEQGLSSSAQGYVALAQRELERVGQISRQTLNFSRETSGPIRARIDELADEVLSLYCRRITEKDIRVQREYECREEAVIYPGEMRQVLSNLVTNALEACSMRGRLRVRIRCTRSWSDPGVEGIRISVADTGSGIDPAVQRRLGEPFFTTKGQRGTGLGLWVTRSIIKRYGGDIQLRSSVDPGRHGTVFSIFLPTNMRPRIVERPRHPAAGGGTGLADFHREVSRNARLDSDDGFPRQRMSGD